MHSYFLFEKHTREVCFFISFIYFTIKLLLKIGDEH